MKYSVYKIMNSVQLAIYILQLELDSITNANVFDFQRAGGSSPTTNSATHVAYTNNATSGKRIGCIRRIFYTSPDAELALDHPLPKRTGMIDQSRAEVKEAALGIRSATDIYI